MKELQLFSNPEFGAVRAVDIDGEPWLVGKDVAQVLGYNDTDQALRKHVDDEDKLTRQIDGSGQGRSMTIINESGLYALALSSKLPGARKFRRWVTAEVLPAIRRTGGYDIPKDYLSALRALAESMERRLLVAHPRKTGERGVSADDVAGTADITNLADNVFSVERVPEERVESEGCSTRVKIIKNRRNGARAVIALQFEETSRRFYEPGENPGKRYTWEAEWNGHG